jgi:hypothetical protein
VGVAELGLPFDGPPVVRFGLRQLVLSRQGSREVGVCLGGGFVAVEFERAPVVVNRLIELSGLGQSPSQAEVAQGVARCEHERPSVARGCFGRPALLEQRVGESDVGARPARLDGHGAREMPLGRRHLSGIQQLRGEAVMGQEVVLGHLDRVRVECGRIAPVGHLEPGAPRQCRDDGGARDGEPGARLCEEVARCPGDGDREADLGEVHVTVGSCLHADLHETDDRYQADQVPQPAHQQIRTRRRQAREEPGDAGERQRRGCGDPRGCLRHGVWVEDREAAGPEAVEDVDPIGVEGVRDAQRERNLFIRRHRAGFALHGDGDRRNGDGDRGEGKLLDDGRSQPCRIESAPGCVAPQPSQGPVVEQQQQQGQRHEHGLGEQAQAEADGDEPVAGDGARPGRVERVGEKGEHPEHTAQRVLALGGPGDGFDVQGVDREDRRDEGARPRRAGELEEGEVEEHGGERVKRDVHEVVARGLESEEGVIDLEGDPRQRDPVRLIGLRKGPDERVAAQSGAQGGIRGDVDRVVVVHEVVVPDLQVDRGGDTAQQQRHRGVGAAAPPASAARRHLRGGLGVHGASCSST